MFADKYRKNTMIAVRKKEQISRRKAKSSSCYAVGKEDVMRDKIMIVAWTDWQIAGNQSAEEPEILSVPRES
jgi:hypothetical protein